MPSFTSFPLLAGPLLLALGLAALPASAQDETFNLAWSGAALGNTATATGTITIDDNNLFNPGSNFTQPGNQFVKAVSVTVAGAGAGNGTFNLSDFSFEVLDTHGGTLDLTKPLIGQPTSGAGFGTTQDGTSGDFNLISNNANPNAPTGKPFFQLVTRDGNGDVMNLTQFSPVLPVPPPKPVVITFDDLPQQPSRTDAVPLSQANDNSFRRDGVTFSSNVFVVGDQNSFVFTQPHSGHFCLTPGGQEVTTLTTTRLLDGLWLGQDVIFGSSLATSVTVSALHGSTVLASDSESLTSTKMFFMDTSNFSALSGITGYTLTSTPGIVNGQNVYDYAADDFTFDSPAAVPEASSVVSFGLLLTLGLGSVMAARRKKAV